MGFAFRGQFKESDAASKVCVILNWLGDNAYEIYEHLHWAASTAVNLNISMTSSQDWEKLLVIVPSQMQMK